MDEDKNSQTRMFHTTYTRSIFTAYADQPTVS